MFKTELSCVQEVPAGVLAGQLAKWSSPRGVQRLKRPSLMMARSAKSIPLWSVGE